MNEKLKLIKKAQETVDNLLEQEQENPTENYKKFKQLEEKFGEGHFSYNSITDSISAESNKAKQLMHSLRSSKLVYPQNKTDPTKQDYVREPELFTKKKPQ